VHVAPPGHRLPSSTVPSQSSSRQLHCSGEICWVWVHVTWPLMHLLISHVVPVPQTQQFGFEFGSQLSDGSHTQSSSILPSQSSSMPLHGLSSTAGCELQLMTPFKHTVWPMPQLVEQSAGTKSSSILLSQSLSRPSHGSLASGTTSPTHGPNE